MSKRRTFAALLVPLLVAACGTGSTTTSSTTATPSSAPSEPPSTSASPLSPTDAGVQVVLTDHVLKPVRWSPDGQHFALGVETGTAGEGRVDVYGAGGAKSLSFPDGTDAAWLDASTLVTFDTDPNQGGGIVTIHDLTVGSSHALPGRRRGILGNNHGLVAISSIDTMGGYPIQQPPATVSILGHWDPTVPRGAAGYWTEGETIADLGSPAAWSSDGTLLAFLTPPTTAQDGSTSATLARSPSGGAATPNQLAAGGPIPAGLAVRRFPGNERVPVPEVTVDERSLTPWFSPDGRWLAGGEVAIDLQTGTAHKLPGATAGWTPSGDLVLGAVDRPSSIWHPDGTQSSTGLPSGFPVYGPLPGQVAVFSLNGERTGLGAASALVHMGDRSVSVQLYGPSWWSVVWSPDGSAVLIDTETDDAQQVHDSLIRVALRQR